ncbi:MAG: trimethylamine methyltransferase family protein [Alphaproteobacteria bacterium]
MTRDSARHRGRRQVGGIVQQAPRHVVNSLKPLEALSRDQVEAIDDASLRVLETIGVVFESPRALDLLARAGARVDRETRRVRLERGLVAESLAKAPGAFVVRAREPARDLAIGDDDVVFASTAGPPNVSDLDGGRRAGTFRDMCDGLRLIQGLNVLHLVGGAPVAPLDLPAATRHLDMVHAYLTLTDRVFHVWCHGRARVADALDMTAIALGTDRAGLAASPRVLGAVNADSPLGYDGPTLDGMLELVEAGQAVVVTPFTIAGALAPASLAGALVQQNAEALAGIALAQIARPGAPVVYGGFTSNVDMRSGRPAFGTPETVKAALASGQLARRCRLPYRSSNTNTANAVDAQAAYESQMTLWGAMLGHANLVMHAAGWLEGGHVFSFEKLILDAEMLQMMAEVMRPLATDADALGVEAMREVGPGGHFFGAAHTLARYETAFYAPMLSDWRNFETWREAGAEDTARRASRIWKELLAGYQEPRLDEAIAEALRAFTARRKRAIERSAA